MPAVELRDIVTGADRQAVLGLRRAPGQERYLGSMARARPRSSISAPGFREAGVVQWDEEVFALDLAAAAGD